MLVGGFNVVEECVPGHCRSIRVGLWDPGWLGDTGLVHSVPLEVEVCRVESAAGGSDSHDFHC